MDWQPKNDAPFPDGACVVETAHDSNRMPDDHTVNADIAGPVTIINGGTQGLGEAVARKLASPGPSKAGGLLLVGRSADRGTKLAAELTQDGTPSTFVQADIAAADSPARIAEACDTAFGVVHGLVNIAALTTRAHLWTDTPEHFDQMMAINAKAPYFLTQAVTRMMIRDNVHGSIVNVGSVAGTGGPPKLTSYAMSKAALDVLTKNLAFTLLPHHIRVNQVNPGWMDTENEHRIQVGEDGQPDDWLDAAEASRPWGRLIKPWEVANTIAFCLSNDSGVMTGASIDIEQAVLGAGELQIPSLDDVPHPNG